MHLPDRQTVSNVIETIPTFRKAGDRSELFSLSPFPDYFVIANAVHVIQSPEHRGGGGGGGAGARGASAVSSCSHGARTQLHTTHSTTHHTQHTVQPAPDHSPHSAPSAHAHHSRHHAHHPHQPHQPHQPPPNVSRHFTCIASVCHHTLRPCRMVIHSVTAY